MRLFGCATVLFLCTSLLASEGRVTASLLNVRKGPGKAYSILFALPQGEKVTLLAKKGEWYKVRWNGKVGYCHGKYIRVVKVTGKITASLLRVRSGPGTGYRVISTLGRGEVVEILGREKDWYKIRLKPSLSSFESLERGFGWVSSRYVDTGGILPPKGVSTASSSSSSSSSNSDERRFPEGEWKYLGKFKPTFYWIAFEEDFSGPKDTPIYDTSGKLIGYFPKAFVKSLRLEGTGKLRDGRVLTYVRNDRYAFVKNAPYGVGHRNNPLKPFRSLAVDTHIIPAGSVLFIPRARGVRLPDGSVHDGIFYAHDVGSAIRGKRLDIFVAHKEWRRFFEKAGIRSFRPIEVYIRKNASTLRRGIVNHLEGLGD